MNTQSTVCDNPFATRFVRPGAIAYRPAHGQTMETFVTRLRANRWWGQIVGPHGSGKSTLLATLLPELEHAGRRPLVIRLCDRHHRDDAIPIQRLAGDRLPATQLIIDGYEQFSRIRRWLARRAIRRIGGGLLVTTHRPLGLPTLAHTSADLATVLRLAQDLLGGTWTTIGQEDVVARFAHRQGNVREILFDLYDLFERRRQ